MNILVIPSYYPSSEKPEDAVFVKEQVEALHKAGHQVQVLSIQIDYMKQRKKHFGGIKQEVQNGVPVYYKYMRAVAPMNARTVITWQFTNTLLKTYEEIFKGREKVDVLYAHFSYPAGAAAAHLSRRTGIPLVVEEHFSGLMKDRIDSNLKKAVQKAVNGAKSFICVSNGLKDHVEQLVGCHEQITVMSNMINPCFQYHEREEKNVFTFLGLGNLVVRKGYDVLIEAFAKEFKKDEKVQLRIAGSGSELKHLEQLVDRFDIKDRVIFLGHVNRQQTLEEYIHCDCFVLPSRAETFGLVYREALAVGRPIISTKHGGFTKADWSDDYGFLIDIDSVEQLQHAMRQIYENYKSYDLNGISQKCLATCSKEVVVQGIINWLEKARI